MRRFRRHFLFLTLTSMLCIQAMGLHVHVGDVAVGQEIELHQSHLNPLVAQGHGHGHESGHDHEGEVDVDIAQVSSPVSADKSLKSGFVPLAGSVSAMPEFVSSGVVLTPLDVHSPGPNYLYGLRPPLRAPPQSA